MSALELGHLTSAAFPKLESRLVFCPQPSATDCDGSKVSRAGCSPEAIDGLTVAAAVLGAGQPSWWVVKFLAATFHSAQLPNMERTLHSIMDFSILIRQLDDLEQ